MKNFTDEQIIEIFKYCAESDCDDCYNCVARKDGRCAIPDLDAQVIQVINRQAAEIIRLKGSVVTNNIMEIARVKKEAKAEAIKEFAKRVKEEICKNTYAGFDKKGNPVNIWEAEAGFKDIDNLVKEITEGKQ